MAKLICWQASKGGENLHASKVVEERRLTKKVLTKAMLTKAVLMKLLLWV